MDSARLTRCLNPQSIAVIGGDEAARVIQQCRRLNFGGDIWSVNPAREAMQGIACVPAIDALPAPPDAAFIAIPARASVDAVAALARAGAGGAVCYASGFSEVGGDGEARQRRLVETAGAMPVIGPNCYGFLNLLSGAALWPDYHGAARMDGDGGGDGGDGDGAPRGVAAANAPRGVAIFSQSGNVSLNLTMQRRLLPLAWLVSLGNQAVVGVEDCIAAALDEPRIAAIGLHIEGLRDLPRFAQLAEQARQRRVPLVALKAGRTLAGAALTFSHTATLAGEDALYDALFARLGVARVATPEELIETLKYLAVAGPLPGNRIASMSCSGGEATLVADLAAAHDLQFPALDAARHRAVQATLGDAVAVDNPLDYHTYIWADRARMTATFRAFICGDGGDDGGDGDGDDDGAGDGFDLTLLVLDMPGDDRAAFEIWMRAVHAFIDACDGDSDGDGDGDSNSDGGGRGAVVTLLSENLPAEAGRELMQRGIVPLHGLAQALTAVAAAAAIGRAWAAAAAAESSDAAAELPSLLPITAPGEKTVTLDEHQAKRRLAAAGLSVPNSQVVDSAAAAVAAVKRLGGAVAIKTLATHIAHKTEVGAVAVNLRDAATVRAHATRMLKQSERLLVESMVDGVAEVLLGIGHDRQFGHYLIIGFGGAWVELFGDRQLLLPPLNRALVTAALSRLKTAALLRGYRGRPPADVDSVVEAALRLCRMVENEPDIIEVEINPLVVKSRPETDGGGDGDNPGAVAVDALMTLRGGHDSPRQK
ncbi:MAG: acetate--CoA ligase family protein [Gammaproteobacteria bacterium]|nr:acetate--CoA ligase family protein [Gammaproteobacteria bacterium]